MLFKRYQLFTHVISIFLNFPSSISISTHTLIPVLITFIQKLILIHRVQFNRQTISIKKIHKTNLLSQLLICNLPLLVVHYFSPFKRVIDTALWLAIRRKRSRDMTVFQQNVFAQHRTHYLQWCFSLSNCSLYIKRNRLRRDIHVKQIRLSYSLIRTREFIEL